MAVKLLDFSSLARDLELAPGFSVRVKYTPRPVLLALLRETQDMADADAAKKWAGACIEGWTGLTGAVARSLNVPFEDDPGGLIPFDADAAALLWLYGDGNRVGAKVQAFSFKLLETVEKEKADSKNVSGASSAPTSTP